MDEQPAGPNREGFLGLYEYRRLRTTRTVEHLTDQYIALLDHDHRLVRLNACWMLGHVRANPAASQQDDIRLNDDDERVRNRAAWALTEIDQPH